MSWWEQEAQMEREYQADLAHAATKRLLREAISIIEGLSDQQAMPDDFYVEPLKRFKEHLS
jgi:hypothetical protein